MYSLPKDCVMNACVSESNLNGELMTSGELLLIPYHKISLNVDHVVGKTANIPVVR